MLRLKDLESLDNVSLDLDAVHPVSNHSIKDTFCNDWDHARVGLENVVFLVKNPIVKLIINIVIGIGNGIQGKICDTPPKE